LPVTRVKIWTAERPLCEVVIRKDDNGRVSPTKRLLAPLILAVLATTALTACSEDPGPGQFADKFLHGWSTGDFTDAVIVRPNGDRVDAQVVKDEMKALSSLTETKPTVKNNKSDIAGEAAANVEVGVSQPIPGAANWEYTTTLKLRKTGDTWESVWEPAVLHPQLKSGERLETRRIAQARGAVVGANGEELMKLRPTVTIGIWPSKVTGDKDQFVNSLVATLAPVFQVSNPADLATRAKNPANAEQFLEVVTLRREVYDQVRPGVQALAAGLSFREEQRMLAESSTFAAPLLGRVGAVTSEIMEKNPGVYNANDQVGLGGLQQRYDERLRGKSGAKVVIARKAPDGTIQETALHTVDAVQGVPLKLSLSGTTQRAAEAALSAAPGRNASLVAIRVSDGHILAAANSGVDYNMAFTANVPPGSTFKTVTAVGLLENGKITPDQGVACPQVFNVAGRPPIHNSGMFSIPGNPAFSVDFYRSCNTAFASLAPLLGGDGLAKAGASVGLGQPWDLGAEAFSGKVSQNGDAGEQAAASFGQGTTIVSPLSMAGVAAAVARGQWKQPLLVLDPAPAKPAPDAPALKPTTVEPLRAMMRQVITDGTATQLADIPAAVHGKTGTAEYVTGDPSKTHAWFIGWMGDIAFAVFVEQGVRPAESALPITEAFLRSL
jgi:cell division protein FtsI/penicillin-binding protein 2